MTRPRPVLFLARAAGLLLATLAVVALGACASTGPSAETSDIFEAAPWPSGESLRYQVVNAQGDDLGTGTLESSPDDGLIALHQSYAEAETPRSEEHTSELHSLMRLSYAVFCLK